MGGGETETEHVATGKEEPCGVEELKRSKGISPAGAAAAVIGHMEATLVRLSVPGDHSHHIRKQTNETPSRSAFVIPTAMVDGSRQSSPRCAASPPVSEQRVQPMRATTLLRCGFRASLGLLCLAVLVGLLLFCECERAAGCLRTPVVASDALLSLQWIVEWKSVFCDCPFRQLLPKSSRQI